MNFANNVDIRSRDGPGELATRDPSRGMTYGELAAGADAVATGLAERGVDITPAPSTLAGVVTRRFHTAGPGALAVATTLQFGHGAVDGVCDGIGSGAPFTAGQFEGGQ